ncbi:hypothetical protein NP590_07380 [Methylomonas sp. SURF-2]|uniref:Secreted protein n=1 Tax=Methylomonas subterranea TaxID=2952225 RepID=A0ABT1TER4_9GAMM|nr:hypothetical protein [Methylomonas sp. SURF-2]MCQ8103920.1 hypothetical protein [Methylomonas sp. SURF-2]
MKICFMKRLTLLGLSAGLLSSAIVLADTPAGGDNIGAIQFELAADDPRQFGFELSASDIAARVRANLAEWEYPFPDSGPYSHLLRARIGEITHGDTPVGFSFSSGNSDPRALDFQKADVLPVECVFQRIDGEVLLAEAKSTFSARPLGPENGQARIVDKLVDQLSTACLNLLEDLPRPQNQKQAHGSMFKPKWMPDVRVEVKEVPVPVPHAGNAAAAPVEQSNNVELKKEIIIHNQGNPVIFTFGHERR